MQPPTPTRRRSPRETLHPTITNDLRGPPSRRATPINHLDARPRLPASRHRKLPPILLQHIRHRPPRNPNLPLTITPPTRTILRVNNHQMRLSATRRRQLPQPRPHRWVQARRVEHDAPALHQKRRHTPIRLLEHTPTTHRRAQLLPHIIRRHHRQPRPASPTRLPSRRRPHQHHQPQNVATSQSFSPASSSSPDYTADAPGPHTTTARRRHDPDPTARPA